MRRHAKAWTAGPNRQKAARLVLPVSLLAALLALLVVVGSVGAKTHLPKETFGSAAQPTFTAPRAVAVDQSTGDVLVMDAGTPPSIKRFNPDGTPDNFSALGSNVIDGEGGADATPQAGLSFASASESQIAIDNSGGATDGDIYVTANPNLIDIFSSTGAYLGQLTAAGATNFSEACGVAVDTSGAVFVGDYTGGIHKFVPAANPVVNTDNTATFTTTTEPCTIATGAGASAGFVFPAQYIGPISKVDSSTGELKYTVSSDNHTTVSVNPSTGNVYGATGSTVKEFDASGAGSATLVSNSPSAANVLQGIAVRSTSGDVYLTRFANPKVEVLSGTLSPVPELTTTAATGVTPTSATLNGTVNPDGGPVTECVFEWGKTTSYGNAAPCVPGPGGIGSGTSPVAVQASLTGLETGGTYHYRLKAANAIGPVFAADQSVLTTGPTIAATWSEDVAYSEATLKAEINPRGQATTYHLEYGTTTSYGEQTPEFAVGSDSSIHKVTRFLEGLSPDTTYHYRVVATNSTAANEGSDLTFTTFAHEPQNTSCPNQQFRVGPAAVLPDCRGYEMVSPIDKNGGDITSLGDSFGQRVAYEQASVDGDKITYSSYKSFADQPSSQQSNQYMATRTADGWITHGINAPQGLTVGDPGFSLPELFNAHFQAFSPDLSSAWIRDYNKEPLSPNALHGNLNLYRQDTSLKTYEPLTQELFGPMAFFPNFRVQAVSDDLQHVLFVADAALTPDAPANTESKLYDFVNGSPELVSIKPNGEPMSSQAYGGSDEAHVNNRSSNYERIISSDGSRIFWSGAAPSPEVGEAIYVRVDGQSTVQVSPGVLSQNLQWWTASADGSRVIYSLGDAFHGMGDLYEFDVDTETRTLIAGQSSGVLGSSKDTSYLYFTSREVLDGDGVAGQPNLYLDHDGDATFVATLSEKDIGLEQTGGGFLLSNTTASPVQRTSKTTPDGRRIVFMSTRSLTGYDNRDAADGVPASEIFTYNATTGQITCVSCRPSGARPRGKQAKLPYVETEQSKGALSDLRMAAVLPTWEYSTYGSRALSDDGSRIFFNSYDAILPQDTNGKQDVYEWEEQGAGDCVEPGGCVRLISTGESSHESEFVDASADGDDVFFKTLSSLDPRDPGLIDIYDARVNGGLTVPPEPPTCVGDACQAVPTPPSNPTPASAAFRGAGNAKVARRRCAGQGRRARSLRTRAKQVGSRDRATALRLERRAKQLKERAKRCRRSNGGAGR